MSFFVIAGIPNMNLKQQGLRNTRRMEVERDAANDGSRTGNGIAASDVG